MVVFLKWTIRGNMYCAVVRLRNWDESVRVMWNSKSERLYVNASISLEDFIDIKSGFAHLYNSYIDGKCKLGEPKSFTWT